MEQAELRAQGLRRLLEWQQAAVRQQEVRVRDAEHQAALERKALEEERAKLAAIQRELAALTGGPAAEPGA